jgi:PAS domain S-box-containing protein
MERLFELPASKLIGLTDEDLFGEEAGAHIGEVDSRVLGGETIEEEHTKPVEGIPTTFYVIKVPMRDSSGEIIGLCGIARDITARKRAEAERERLLAAEHEQRLLAETLREVTLALTSQTSHAAVMDESLRQAQRIVPHSTANIALLKDDALHIAHWRGYQVSAWKDWGSDLVQPLADWPLDAEVVRSRKPLVIPDTHQEPRWVVLDETAWIKSYLSVPLRLRDRVLGLLRLDGDTPGQFSAENARRLQPLASAAAIAIENARLVENLEAEVAARTAEIRAEQEKNEAILRSVGHSIVMTDLENRIQYVNEAFTTLTGYTAQEAIGRHLRFLFGEAMTEQKRQSLRLTLAQSQVWQGETSRQRKDGRAYDAALTIAPLRDAEGHLAGYVSSHHDISRIKGLDRARSRFATNVSHQLRTPLATLKTFIYLLRKGTRPEKADRYLQMMEEEIAQLAHLIQDILEMTTLDSGRAVTAWEPVSLPIVVGDIVTRFHDQAEASGLTLVATPIPPDLPVIKGNYARLFQALEEIVENAIIFTPAGGQVTVDVETIEDEGWSWVTITVRDTGPGISPDEQERVFDRFFRGSLAESGHIPGAGLGLSITQEIVRAHGGRVTVESELGRGSAFRLWLRSAPR